MAYAPIFYIAAQYEDYENWWLKCYQQGTTTPLTMATDSSGGTTAAKFEINANGFLKTSGSAIVTPHVNQTYDAWIFPTEAEADANDTTNALQLADNLTALPPNVTNNKVIQFETVADMVAATFLSVGDFAWVAGYDSVNDGGHGFFEIVGQGTGTDDGGSFIDLDTHQAKLLCNGSFDIKQFGAQAGTAADQQAAIANAVTFAADNGFTLIISPDGSGNKDYQINSQVIFNKDDLTVYFEGGAYFKPVDSTLLKPLLIGGTSPEPSRMDIRNPSVQRAAYDGATENRGIVFIEMNQSTIVNPESRFSKYNLAWEPDSGGNSYNTYINPQGIGGYYNWWLDASSAGYTNENVFIGGRTFSTANTNTNLRLDAGGLGTGANKFFGCSLEGQGSQGVYDNGDANEFYGCRPEGTWSSGYFHVLGPNNQYSLIQSQRIDYTIDTSGATDPRVLILGYRQGSQMSTANNGIVTLSLENQSASGGSGLEVSSNLDNDSSYIVQGKRKSDGLVRFEVTTNGELKTARSVYVEQSGYNFEPLRIGSDWFWVDGNYLRHHGSAPSAATDGRIMVENQTSVAAGLGNIANVVNTTDKYTGKEVFDTGLNRPVWATGSAAGDTWVYSDGTTAYTPS